MLSQSRKSVKINWFVKYDLRLDLSIMISGPENYRDFQETGPLDQAPSLEKMTNDRKQEANRAGKEASLTPGLSDCV